MDFKIGQLSMDRTQILNTARREIDEHFKFLKANFSGSHGEINPNEEDKVEFGPLAHISVDELIDDDLLMWHRVQDYKKGGKMITPEDLVKYRTNVDMNRNDSRTALAASIAEIITGVGIKREIKKSSKKNGKK